jgi:hypothetical protein
MSMITGKCPRFSAQHEVTYTGNVRFLVMTMSETSKVTEGLCGLVVGVSGAKVKQEFSTA